MRFLINCSGASEREPKAQHTRLEQHEELRGIKPRAEGERFTQAS